MVHIPGSGNFCQLCILSLVAYSVFFVVVVILLLGWVLNVIVLVLAHCACIVLVYVL